MSRWSVSGELLPVSTRAGTALGWQPCPVRPTGCEVDRPPSGDLGLMGPLVVRGAVPARFSALGGGAEDIRTLPPVGVEAWTLPPDTLGGPPDAPDGNCVPGANGATCGTCGPGLIMPGGGPADICTLWPRTPGEPCTLAPAAPGEPCMVALSAPGDPVIPATGGDTLRDPSRPTGRPRACGPGAAHAGLWRAGLCGRGPCGGELPAAAPLGMVWPPLEPPVWKPNISGRTGPACRVALGLVDGCLTAEPGLLPPPATFTGTAALPAARPKSGILSVGMDGPVPSPMCMGKTTDCGAFGHGGCCCCGCCSCGSAFWEPARDPGPCMGRRQLPGVRSFDGVWSLCGVRDRCLEGLAATVALRLAAVSSRTILLKGGGLPTPGLEKATLAAWLRANRSGSGSSLDKFGGGERLSLSLEDWRLGKGSDCRGSFGRGGEAPTSRRGIAGRCSGPRLAPGPAVADRLSSLCGSRLLCGG
mmetsp:Transcript_90748/g.287535  ORF Transcript_90748/g.287535 Transcript_90748/m.287535 type:complete len:474 (+) Transcript_90748:302-1723(+)